MACYNSGMMRITDVKFDVSCEMTFHKANIVPFMLTKMDANLNVAGPMKNSLLCF